MKNQLQKNNEIWLIYIIILIILIVVGTVIAAVFITKNDSNNQDIEVSAAINTPTYTIEPTFTMEEVIITPEPTETPVPEIPLNIKEYKEKNADTIGYIKIDGTVIDYPVMYSGDNEFYLHNDFDKQSSYYGAIFLDFRCDVYDMAKTRNIILYGHRMKDGSMFRSLVYYFEKDFFDAHRIIQFDTLAGEMDWEVFAIYEANIDFYYINTEFEDDEQWLEFIKYCQQLSLYETDVMLGKDDIVLTLSTCSTDKQHRVVVMARLVQ